MDLEQCQSWLWAFPVDHLWNQSHVVILQHEQQIRWTLAIWQDWEFQFSRYDWPRKTTPRRHAKKRRSHRSTSAASKGRRLLVYWRKICWRLAWRAPNLAGGNHMSAHMKVISHNYMIVFIIYEVYINYIFIRISSYFDLVCHYKTKKNWIKRSHGLSSGIYPQSDED